MDSQGGSHFPSEEAAEILCYPPRCSLVNSVGGFPILVFDLSVLLEAFGGLEGSDGRSGELVS